MRGLLVSLSIVLALGAAPLLSSCGAAGFAVAIGDGYYDPYYYHHYYNGDWRGDYVYWRGDWYYRGIGTPYWDEWYDPYPYWW